MTNGYRIKQIRELGGFTQEELAEGIGIKQPTLAEYERGSKDPPEAKLRAIAFQLGFPPAFFREPCSQDFPLGTHLLYRTRPSLQKREDKVKAHRFTETVFQGIDKLGEEMDLIKPKIPQIREDPVSAAKRTRIEMGLAPDKPVENIIRVAERAGVRVIPVPLPIPDPDAFSVWAGLEGQYPVIGVVTNRSGDRARLSVAHELGHLVLHRPLRVSVQESEEQAYKFGAELLMPAETIRPELEDCQTLTELARLKPRWKVSIQALIRRALDLEVINQRRYYYLFQQLSVLGWRTREPENLDIPEERPRLFRKMVEMLFGIPIDYEKMCTALAWPESFCRTVVEAHSGGNGTFKEGPGRAPSPLLRFRPSAPGPAVASRRTKEPTEKVFGDEKK